jgi:hypothetical protein
VSLAGSVPGRLHPLLYTLPRRAGLGNAAGRSGIAAGPLPPQPWRVLAWFGGPAHACADTSSAATTAPALTQNATSAMATSPSDARNLAARRRRDQRLATEMSRRAAQREVAAMTAMHRCAGDRHLTAAGVLGALVARRRTIDTGGVTGVSPDLVVRPFGWKGHAATLREIAKEEFRLHLGLVAMSGIRCHDAARRRRLLRRRPVVRRVDRDGITSADDGMVDDRRLPGQLGALIQPPDDPERSTARLVGR